MLCSVQPSGVLFSYFKPTSDVKAFETTSFRFLTLSSKVSSLLSAFSYSATNLAFSLEYTLKECS